jgi:hypothetical protein
MASDKPGIETISQPVTNLPGPSAADEQAAVRSLVTVITFLLIFIMAARTPLDTDLWWHLSAGREMLRTGHLLNTDIFSFTRLGAHWVNPYWLGDVLSAWLFQQGGFLALGTMTTLLVLLSMGLVFLQSDGPVFLKSAALLLGGVVASVVWTPRPHLYSLVLLAAVGYLLYLYKYRGKDRLWVLPLLFIFWSNVHGGYPLGIILIGCFLAGEAANHLLKLPIENRLPWAKMIRLGGWAVVCGLAVLINPNGLDMWRLPFQTVNMQVLQQFIPEWSSPDFHQVLEQSLLWLLLGLFTAVGISGKTMDAGDLITTIVFAYMALLAKRNYGPFALVAVPIFVRYAGAAIQSWRMRAPWVERLAARRAVSTGAAGLKKIINLSLVTLLALVAFGKLYGVSHPALVGHYLSQGYPLAAVEWINQNRPASRVLNEYHWGGFLQWAMPASKIFVDGRTDLYGDEVVDEWIQAVQAGAEWQSILTRYDVTLAMLEPERPLAQALAQAGWALVYQDSQVVLYEK